MRPKKRKLHELLNTEIVKPLVVLQRVQQGKRWLIAATVCCQVT